MQTITIDPKALAAVRIFAAHEDIRYYLNAVHLEATAKTTRLVATDGHMLGLHDAPAENLLGSNCVDVLIPLNAIDALKPDLKFPISLELADDGKSGKLTQYETGVQFKAVEGKFPQYTRVIPAKVSGEAGFYADSLLTRIFKAQKVFDKKASPILFQSGPMDSAVFQLVGSDSFVGVLMPMNPNGHSKPLPTVPDTAFARQSLQDALLAKQKESAFLD